MHTRKGVHFLLFFPAAVRRAEIRLYQGFAGVRKHCCYVAGGLVGIMAITYVLVNDPTRGYGIFIDTMLDAAA